VADALALFVATAAHALAASGSSATSDDAQEEAFLGSGRDAAAGVAACAVGLALALHGDVLVWGQNGAGRRLAKAAAREPHDDAALRLRLEAELARMQAAASAAREVDEGGGSDVELSSSVGPLESSRDPSRRTSSDFNFSAAAQAKVDTLMVRRMSLDLLGNASFVIDVQVKDINRRVFITPLQRGLLRAQVKLRDRRPTFISCAWCACRACLRRWATAAAWT
jgi:hypothetical protein